MRIQLYDAQYVAYAACGAITTCCCPAAIHIVLVELTCHYLDVQFQFIFTIVITAIAARLERLFVDIYQKKRVKMSTVGWLFLCVTWGRRSFRTWFRLKQRHLALWCLKLQTWDDCYFLLFSQSRARVITYRALCYYSYFRLRDTWVCVQMKFYTHCFVSACASTASVWSKVCSC